LSGALSLEPLCQTQNKVFEYGSFHVFFLFCFVFFLQTLLAVLGMEGRAWLLLGHYLAVQGTSPALPGLFDAKGRVLVLLAGSWGEGKFLKRSALVKLGKFG
jgi:hypothetical protein